MAHPRLGVLCITLELILNPLNSFVELWPRGRLGALAVIEVRAVEIITKTVGNYGTNKKDMTKKTHIDIYIYRRFKGTIFFKGTKGTEGVLRFFHIFPT